MIAGLDRPLCPCHGEPMRVSGDRWQCATVNREYVYAAYARSDRIIAAEIEARGSRCLDCGMAWEEGVFDWHHRDPDQKVLEVMGMRSCSPHRLRAELAKCDLLCANCHRRRHRDMDRKSSRRLTDLAEVFSVIQFEQLSLEAVA